MLASDSLSDSSRLYDWLKDEDTAGCGEVIGESSATASLSSSSSSSEKSRSNVFTWPSDSEAVPRMAPKELPRMNDEPCIGREQTVRITCRR